MEGKGPKISKENGNKFFPYIKVSSSGKRFKVNYKPWFISFSGLNPLNSRTVVVSSITTLE